MDIVVFKNIYLLKVIQLFMRKRKNKRRSSGKNEEKEI